MDDRYPIPRPVWPDCHETTLLVKRSRFLTHAARAGSPAEAKAFIEAVSLKHADATHNCWAYVAGPPGSTARIGCSDDGEPHGTAGRPMLQVLLHSGIGDVACVATRWFGGIKLGTGAVPGEPALRREGRDRPPARRSRLRPARPGEAPGVPVCRQPPCRSLCREGRALARGRPLRCRSLCQSPRRSHGRQGAADGRRRTGQSKRTRQSGERQQPWRP